MKLYQPQTVPHSWDLSCLNQDSSSAVLALSALHWQAQGRCSQQPQRCPGKQSPCGRAMQQLSCWTIQGNANGLTQLSLPEPTPERKHFSTSWYSQAGLEVFISGLFDNCQFHSLLIIFVPWNYRKPFLFLFNFIPFQSFYYFSHSRWQGSLSQTEIYRNALQKKCFYWGWKMQLSRQKSVRRQFPMRVSVALWVNIEVLKAFHNCITS